VALSVKYGGHEGIKPNWRNFRKNIGQLSKNRSCIATGAVISGVDLSQNMGCSESVRH